jgi:hypothetical protein
MLREVGRRLVEQPQPAAAGVALENVARAVLGAVVAGDHEVDAGGAVVIERGRDDVRLVAYQERQDDAHRVAARG